MSKRSQKRKLELQNRFKQSVSVKPPLTKLGVRIPISGIYNSVFCKGVK